MDEGEIEKFSAREGGKITNYTPRVNALLILDTQNEVTYPVLTLPPHFKQTLTEFVCRFPLAFVQGAGRVLPHLNDYRTTATTITVIETP